MSNTTGQYSLGDIEGVMLSPDFAPQQEAQPAKSKDSLVAEPILKDEPQQDADGDTLTDGNSSNASEESNHTVL